MRFERALRSLSHAVVALWLIVGQVVSHTAVASAEQASSQVFSVGLLNFENESRLNMRPDLLQKIAEELRQKFISTYNDVLPRLIGTHGDSQVKAMTVEQLSALGRQYGVRFVVRGALLDLTREGDGQATTYRARLYADVISVESATITTLRAEGAGAQGVTSASGRALGTSAMEQALSGAVDQLASAIHQIIAEAPDMPERVVAERKDAQVDSIESQGAPVAETDEELRQLIAQADELISSGAAGADNLKKLSRALQRLRAALEVKATLLERNQDTVETDREITAGKAEVQAAISAITEELSSNEAPVADTASSSTEKRNVLARIGEYLGELANIVQRIQEVRAAFRGAAVSTPYDQTGGQATERQPTMADGDTAEEISGVITDSGKPVEGATVTESASGAAATTDTSGAYNLKGVLGRGIAKLIVTKNGRRVAAGQVYLAGRRSAVADFELKPRLGAVLPSARVIPQTIVVDPAKSPHGASGILKGTVEDTQGRPVSHALVDLRGVAIARTDARGKYVILNVPAGAHNVTVTKSRMRAITERVHVQPGTTAQSVARLSPDHPVLTKPAGALAQQKTGAFLRGVIFDENRQPVAGAKLTLTGPRGALYGLSHSHGTYEFKGLLGGLYRLVVSKAGYIETSRVIAVADEAAHRANFRLIRGSSRPVGKADQQRMDSGDQHRTASVAAGKKPVLTYGSQSNKPSSGKQPVTVDASQGNKPQKGKNISIENQTANRVPKTSSPTDSAEAKSIAGGKGGKVRGASSGK